LIYQGPFLLDSNVLVHLTNQDSPEHATVVRCLDTLWGKELDLTYTSQNLAEFWNVCTRPSDRNGFGVSVTETDQRVRILEARLRLLEDSVAVHKEWRKLIVEAGVSGMQVHDARLVAAMKVHRIETILTYNLRDFRRFAGVVAVSPAEIPDGSY